jgi:hypothetical protein
MKPITGLRTVVKFFTNVQPRGGGTIEGKPKIHNHLITRTLGKLGVVDSKWQPSEDSNIPNDGEFWLVEILRETSPAKAQGVFVLAPIRRIETSDVQRLAPGMYEEESDEGTVIITPRLREDFYWMLPLSLRKAMIDTNAVVVRYLWD